MSEARETAKQAAAGQETLNFEAEVARLLQIMVHSVYSEREIFLRELVSNAADACDRLRYEAITAPELVKDEASFEIAIDADAEAGTLTVVDNGIGMSRDELVANLGTIAKSGTSAFVEGLSGDAKKDLALIGQFGVGFYSVFMVADEVRVVSRRAGAEEAWAWTSDGLGSYMVAPAERAGRGTTITLRMKADAREFLDEARLRTVIETYSNHVPVPVRLTAKGREVETVNAASALWTRARKDIGPEDYANFYRHVAHALDEPWHVVHYKAEGRLEYSVLLFVPSARPFDLFDPARRPCVKLYVKRVFVTEACEDVVPSYLRFLRGVIDSEDLPLNLSREILQNNPVVGRIREGVTNRVLAELETKARDEPEAYAAFWENFGAVLKEGIYEDEGRRAQLLKLARFRSTAAGGLQSLADYAGRMKEGQEAIYYITGDEIARLKSSPQLEGFAARGLEVLLLTDPVDDFWLTSVADFEGKPFLSVTRGAADLDRFPEAGEKSEKVERPSSGTLDLLVAVVKETLGERVKDVRLSSRLRDSAVCLVADQGDIDMRLQRLLKAHGHDDGGQPRILEINPDHALIRALAARAGTKGVRSSLEEAALLLLDSALVVEGEPLADPAGFARRLSAMMAKAVGTHASG